MVLPDARFAHEALLNRTLEIDPASRSHAWMVLHTRSRQEKAVARHLEAAKVAHFLPLYQHTKVHNGRRVRSWLPLFPGYVFLFGEREDAFGAIETKRVCRVLGVTDQARFINEIEQIALALTAGAALGRHARPVIGRRYRIARGPFMGIEGVAIRQEKITRLILQVDLLGQGAALEVEQANLELLN